ncbi:glycosyltransferase family 4 protein [Spongiivirga sp. MCCC 1A20706]|uniref:glycosyltransferase family 4 protein n=1 Tax=Spongiivirga sp. MCCC 1A20706 TaxID=3160963 RepID=UPI0039774AB5
MKKKICFIVSSPYTMMFLVHQLKEFSKDYEVHLVANINDENKHILKHQKFDTVKHIPLSRNINPVKDLVSVFQLYKYFKAMGFDSIHSITPKAGLITAISGKLAKIPNRFHIFTGQVWATKTGLFRRLLKALDKIIVRFSSHILVDGRSQREFLISENVLTEGQATVLGSGSISGIDLNQFSPNNDTRLKIREDIKIKDDIVVYLFLGRLNADKGIVELARAFSKLSRVHSKVFLLLVGVDEGNMMEKISEIIDKEKYYFAGSTPQPEQYYQASDVFCLPSHREGFGMSAIEASACEIPVVCSDAYGLLDTIVDNETGLRHKVGDMESLYAQMNKLSEDEALRKFLGSNGRKYIEENFSVERLIKEWVNFYKERV